MKFIAAKYPEGRLTEYKSIIPDNKSIAKSISAFANTDGGILVYGVETDDEDKPIECPRGVRYTEGIDRKITSIGLNGINPPYPPPIVKILKNPGDPERCFVFIRVFESDSTPHTVNDGKDIYHRINAQSEPIKASGEKAYIRRARAEEIEFLFNRRAKTITFREHLIASARDRFRRNNPNSRRPSALFETLFTPAFPKEPLRDIKDLNRCISHDSDIGIGLILEGTHHETISIPGGVGVFRRPHSEVEPFYIEFNQFGMVLRIWEVEFSECDKPKETKKALAFDRFATPAYQHYLFFGNYLRNTRYLGLGRLIWRASCMQDVEVGYFDEEKAFWSYCSSKDDSFEIVRDFTWTGERIKSELLEDMVSEFARNVGCISRYKSTEDDFLNEFQRVVRVLNAKYPSPTR